MSLYTDPLFIEAELAWRRQRDAVGPTTRPSRRRRPGRRVTAWLTPRARRSPATTRHA